MLSSHHRRIFSLIISIALVLCILPLPSAAGADAPVITTVSILHTNDMHGRFYQVDGNNTGMIGIDVLAAVKNGTPNAILVDAGDAIHGLPIANVNRGKNAIDMMTAAGYDVMTPGNHEFNYGSGRLEELAGEAAEGGLAIISSNIFNASDGGLFLPATAAVEVDGVKVGFFGLTTQTTPIQTSPANVAGLEFRAYGESAEAAIATLKAEGADVIVAIAHISRPDVEALAVAFGDDIDVIIEGHDHLHGYETVNGVLIAGAGDYMTGIGVVTIDLGSGGEVAGKAARSISKDDASETEGDPEVKALAESIKGSLLAEYGIAVAKSDVFISSARGSEDELGVRNSEQPLGNLVTDAMRAAAGADVAIVNGGGLRADIMAGDITRLDINAVLPFGNVLVVKEATPKDIKAALEQGLRDAPAAVGWFPHVSGIAVEYNPLQTDGNRVSSIKLGGMDLDPDDDVTMLTLATNDFMANGGDGYTAIQSLSTVAELDSLDSVLEQYILSLPGGAISEEHARIEGRLARLDTGVSDPPAPPPSEPAPEPVPEPVPVPQPQPVSSPLLTTDGISAITLPLPAAGRSIQYTVQPGETLWGIAFNYYGSMQRAVVNRVYAANAPYLRSTGGLLEAGAVLTLPERGMITPVTQSHLDQAAGLYLVKRGDTLSGIALRYYGDASLWPQIYEANKARVRIIGNSPMIYEGQWLVVTG